VKGSAKDSDEPEQKRCVTQRRDALHECSSHTLGEVRATLRSERCALALFAILAAAFVSLSLAGSRGAASPITTVRALSATSNLELQDAQDYSRFSHASQRHASLACASCHARAADNSTVPRLPGHKACTECHLPQFISQNAPLCSICHASVEGENPPVKNFPALSNFNARFDHAQHNAGAARPVQGCAACHQPSTRRAAALSIPAAFAAHSECYTCHKPDAQVAGRDLASCGTCHVLAARYARTPASGPAFSVGFTHAAHGARQRLSCSDCHQTRAGLPQSRQVTSTRPSEHSASSGFQSCATCHDNRRAFGEARFSDCRRCHTGSAFGRGD
jgi:c(7)-type cytochrome triheme protein